MSRLSLTRGVSLTHDSSATSAPSITNNISINTQPETSSSEPIIETQTVQDKIDNALDKVLPSDSGCAPLALASAEPLRGAGSVSNEVSFLKQIIKIYMNQPIYFECKEIVCAPDELVKLLEALTGGQAELEASVIDVHCGCVSGKDIPVQELLKIWIIKDDARTVFKYSYPQYLTLFDEYNISLKYVRV